MNIETRRFMGAQTAAGLPAVAQGRIGELEVLRTVAILMVLVQHLPFNLLFWGSKYLAPIFRSGTWSGVDLFFAVSGFVIARGLLPQLEGVRDFRKFLHITVTFWIRRAWRLWPSAWFWLAAPLILCLVFNRSGVYGGLLVNWQMAMACLANLANFYVAEHVIYHSGGHATAFAQWSLSLEEQFYLLLPFAAWLLRRHLAVLMGALLIFAFFSSLSGFMLNIRSGAFAAGVLLAIASRHPAYADCAGFSGREQAGTHCFASRLCRLAGQSWGYFLADRTFSAGADRRGLRHAGLGRLLREGLFMASWLVPAHYGDCRGTVLFDLSGPYPCLFRDARSILQNLRSDCTEPQTGGDLSGDHAVASGAGDGTEP
jgi:peptidoglycan/LPS O-acetylase OafA/YrhL